MLAQLPEQGLVGNCLLVALPQHEHNQLLPCLKFVRFPKSRILYETGEAVHYAYFPTNGMASLFAITEDGSTIELGTVGNDGYVGVPILHQVGISAYRATVQVPMVALRIDANAFLFEVNREGILRQPLSHSDSRTWE